MSGLLTQIVRRQALMMTTRRHDSSLLLAGPPVNKVSSKVTFPFVFSPYTQTNSFLI